MNSIQKYILCLSLCITLLTGCFSSTSVYKEENLDNDSSFVQLDEGALVFIRMKDSREFTGELLNVKDTIMFISENQGLTNDELIDSINQINIIQNNRIKSIWLKGKNNHFIGLVFGIALGGAIGYAAGDDSETGEGSFGAPDLSSKKAQSCIFGALGGVIGLLIGAATSTYSEEIYHIESSEVYNFKQLNIYARFGSREPEYLKEIR